MKTVADVLGWTLFVGIGLAGLVSSWFMAVWAGRAVASTGRVVATATSVVAFLLAFLGAWIVFDVVAATRLVSRHRRGA